MNRFKPCSKLFLLTVPRRYIFVDHLCYLCLVFVTLSCLFIVALWSPAGKGLTSWLSSVMFNCVFVTFPCGILGQVWYLIVSIPDRCHLSVLSVLSSFAIILMGRRMLVLPSWCLVAALPHGTVGWSAVCDCGIS